MSKLLKSGFFRIRKSPFFWICLLLCVLTGAGLCVLRFLDIRSNPQVYAELPDSFRSPEAFVFVLPLYFMFINAVWCGSFLGTEYADGMLRTKIISGHSRQSVYISSLFLAMSGCTLMWLAGTAACLLTGAVLLPSWSIPFMRFCQMLGCEWLALMALCSLMVLAGMLIQNKAAASVAIFAGVLVLLLGSLHVDDRLHQRQYHRGYRIGEINPETGTPEMIEETTLNPNYLTGARRDVYQTLYDTLPTCQFLQISQEEAPDYAQLAGISCGLTGLVSAVGIIRFQKQNLQ